MTEIIEVVNKLKRTEEDLLNAKESFQHHIDSLLLFADWETLRRERGISNQPQRDAHIREITKSERRKVKEIEIELNFLKRIYNVYLHQQPATDYETEPMATEQS